jgi:hypothetical protein
VGACDGVEDEIFEEEEDDFADSWAESERAIY